MEKKLKDLNKYACIINLLYLIFINVMYVELPVPNRIYLINLSSGYPYYYIFRDLLYIMIGINLVLFFIYVIVIIKNRISKENRKIK